LGWTSLRTPATRKAAARRPATIHRTTFTAAVPSNSIDLRRLTLQVKSYHRRVARTSVRPAPPPPFGELPVRTAIDGSMMCFAQRSFETMGRSQEPLAEMESAG